MIVAVLSRHAGVALGAADVFVNVAGGVRIDEPGADLAVALAIASAARGIPVRDGMAVFGEIGLTGRLRPAAQAERRLEECAKLGLATVIAPEGRRAAAGPRVTRAETLRQAIAAGLEAASVVAASGGLRARLDSSSRSAMSRAATSTPSSRRPAPVPRGRAGGPAGSRLQPARPCDSTRPIRPESAANLS